MSEGQITIDSECHLPSFDVDVYGSRMHYLQDGHGDPILFIHGMPTYSYLWRNIIPALTPFGRCIALDLIGMGDSDKPDIEYTVFDHIHYFEGFIDALQLKNITLVLHGWGSVIGFEYAARHSENIKAIAFYESHLTPVFDWEKLSLPVQQLSTLLRRPGASYRAIVEHNYLINKLLPHGVLRKLTDAEMDHYRRPFLTQSSRRPLWQYILEIPLGSDDNTEVTALMAHYSEWLQRTEIPKLLLYAVPGFMATIESVQWAKQHLSNLQVVELEDALHFAQESMPEVFTSKLKDWLITLSKN